MKPVSINELKILKEYTVHLYDGCILVGEIDQVEVGRFAINCETIGFEWIAEDDVLMIEENKN